MNGEEKYVRDLDFSGMPPQARPAMIALGQFQNQEEVTQRCPHCLDMIRVEGITLAREQRPCAWKISCLCGKCYSTFRGL